MAVCHYCYGDPKAAHLGGEGCPVCGGEDVACNCEDIHVEGCELFTPATVADIMPKHPDIAKIEAAGYRVETSFDEDDSQPHIVEVFDSRPAPLVKVYRETLEAALSHAAQLVEENLPKISGWAEGSDWWSDPESEDL